MVFLNLLNKITCNIFRAKFPCSKFSISNQKFFTFFSRCYSTKKEKTHYEILNLKNNCTAEDIRLAFLKLSKQYHPDVTKNQKQTEQFLKISEAYQILSKPATRSAYDRRLTREFHGASVGTQTSEMRRPWEIKPDFNPNPGPYYGIKGYEKISNWKIAFILIGITIFGAVFGFVSVNHSFSFHRSQLDEKSKIAGSHLAATRANAEKFGNDEQLRRMVKRIESQKDDS